jgi:hypothetical protein
MIEQELQTILRDPELTLYGLALVIGAETDESIKTIHYRLTRYCQDLPVSIRNLDRDLEALGYQIKIEKKSDIVL